MYCKGSQLNVEYTKVLLMLLTSLNIPATGVPQMQLQQPGSQYSPQQGSSANNPYKVLKMLFTQQIITMGSQHLQCT